MQFVRESVGLGTSRTLAVFRDHRPGWRPSAFGYRRGSVEAAYPWWKPFQSRKWFIGPIDGLQGPLNGLSQLWFWQFVLTVRGFGLYARHNPNVRFSTTLIYSWASGIYFAGSPGKSRPCSSGLFSAQGAPVERGLGTFLSIWSLAGSLIEASGVPFRRRAMWVSQDLHT